MWHQPGAAETISLEHQQLDLNLITDSIKRCFMINLKLMNKPMYKKPYTEREDNVCLSPIIFFFLFFFFFYI